MIRLKRGVMRVLGLGLYGSVSLVALSLNAQHAWAADPLDLGSVEATAAGDDGGEAQPGTAPYEAPTKAPLAAAQPTSVIDQHYIDQHSTPGSDYADIARISPSVWSVDPDGPGLMENQGLFIRGFSDGQYNVTFDGIPWGDSNDFTHHSTSYFMARDLGQVAVDRGPGTAETVGNATFGGTLAVDSKDPLAAQTFDAYGGAGSFGTWNLGGQADSGFVSKSGGTSMFLDAQAMGSDGYLTNEGQQRKNALLKVEQPIGDNTVLTFVTMQNQLHQNVGLGATKQQIQTLGSNWGLSSNPASQDYYGYNQDYIQSDFEYLGLKSDLGGGWTIDNKIYTYAYYHHGYNGLDPNGESVNGVDGNGVVLAQASDVPGQEMKMDYRSVGDIVRLNKQVSFGTLKTGLWYDRQTNSREQYEVDETAGQAITSIDRRMTDALDTIQPYGEVDWKALPGLTLTPGVKYAYFRRTLNATVNQGTGSSLDMSKVYARPLPSAAAHYDIASNWSAYAQVAKGFMAPNLNTFYTVSSNSPGSIKPQETWNYQAGSSYRSGKLTLSGDVYFIDFQNMIGKRTVDGNAEFFNQGGVYYKGVELESSYALTHGFSLYGNGSLNDARQKGTGQWIADAPAITAAYGLIYDKDGLYGSLLNKYVGARYGDTGQTQALDPFNQTDLSLGYTLPKAATNVAPIKAKFTVSNLFDHQGIISLAGYTGGANTPLYWTDPGRSFFFSLEIPM
ncbi:vitamin B12 transporter BtuB [mine drainage metagenome]|uniref:Vitamin B12 transporter BtuB n=1 Tax=mine drainage metagenome TaxID=410659 RepID=A0A1J5REH1_9ZZZZ